MLFEKGFIKTEILTFFKKIILNKKVFNKRKFFSIKKFSFEYFHHQNYFSTTKNV